MSDVPRGALRHAFHSTASHLPKFVQSALRGHARHNTRSLVLSREQILGAEARSRVPEEYLAQLPEAANPPTLFLPLMAIAQALAAPAGGNGAGGMSPLTHGVPRGALLDFLRRAWPRLLLWRQWFMERQAGPEPASFRSRPCNHPRDPACLQSACTASLVRARAWL
jgi:Glycosyl hydrolase family 63 C-terminal domain